MKRLLLLFCFLLWPVVFAQGNPEDDLFKDSIFTEVEDSDGNPAEDLLSSDKVVIGGKFSVALDVDLTLNPGEDEDPFSSGLEDLSSQVFLDARPNSNFAAFIKGDLSYTTKDGVAFELSEAFADVDINNTVFLRAGKQTINWGVGFFFSPANLVNLETINPEDPEAELAGPVAVKAQVPIDSHNLTAYLLMDNIELGDDIGLAARYEFLVGNYEITTGGVWRNEHPWSLMATATGNIKDVSLFLEAVLEGNSDKTFVVKDPSAPLGLSTTSSDSLFVSATLGGRYSYSTEDERYSFSANAQYFFNGKGYENPNIFTDRPEAIAALLGQGNISFADLSGRGQHYAAVNLSSPDIAKSGITPSLFWLGNLQDGSGTASAILQYQGIEHFTPSLTYRYNYGAKGAEYSPAGEHHSLKLSFNFDGSF